MKEDYIKKQQENQKEDKKAFKKFLFILLLSCVVGSVIGFLSALVRDIWTVEISQSVKILGRVLGVYGGYMITIILLLVSMILYRKSRKEFLAWDGEDEDIESRMDVRLSYVSWFAQLIMIFSYFFLGTGAYVQLGNKEVVKEMLDTNFIEWIVNLILVLGSMLFSLVASMRLQQKVVNFTKELNPEKQGSVYDMNFGKKWLGSFDEAEKFITYKSSYTAMKATSYTCMGLWLFCLIGMMSFDFGVLPLVMVLIVWLVQTSTYCLKTIYYGKYPLEVMK